MSCESACYESTVNACTDILLKAGLTANTPYLVQIKKWHRSKIYQAQLATNAQGHLLIPQTFLPVGFLLPGYFKLTVSNGDMANQPLTFDGKQYSCVALMTAIIEKEISDISPTSTVQ